MTAYIAYATSSLLHILSDRAGLNGDGTVANFAPKIQILPGMRGVLLLSGQAGASVLFRQWIAARVLGFEDLISNIASVFADFERDVLALHAGANRRYMAVVAGWPESGGRPQVWSIAGSEDRDKGRHSGKDEKGLVLVNAHRNHVHAELEALGLAHRKAWKAGTEPPPFNAELHAVPCFQAMRRDVSEGHSIVGGGIEELIITREGSTARLIRVWPDQIGQKINMDAPCVRLCGGRAECRDATA